MSGNQLNKSIHYKLRAIMRETRRASSISESDDGYSVFCRTSRNTVLARASAFDVARAHAFGSGLVPDIAKRFKLNSSVSSLNAIEPPLVRLEKMALLFGCYSSAQPLRPSMSSVTLSPGVD